MGLAVSEEPAPYSAAASGITRQGEPAREPTDPEFQNQLITSLSKLTGIALRA